MIWLDSTLRTEVSLAGLAAKPVLAHVISCLRTENVSHFVFSVVVYVTLLNLHKFSTRTFPHPWVLLNQVSDLNLIYLSQLLSCQILFQLLLGNRLTAFAKDAVEDLTLL